MSATPKHRKTKLIVIGSCSLVAIIALKLSFVGILPYRGVSAKESCMAVMKKIDGAKVAWMMDHHKTTNDVPTWQDLVGPNGYLRTTPRCPHGGTYNLGTLSEPATCSIRPATNGLTGAPR
jgi:hypothetical protein